MTELKLKFKKGFAKRAFAVAMALCLVAPLVPSVPLGSGLVKAAGTQSGETPETPETPDDPDPIVKVDKVTVSPATATLTSIGQTTTLKANVTPANATNNKVTWTVSGDAVTVANGVVTAKKNGTATVKATADGKSATATVTVKQAANKVVLSLKGQNLKNNTSLKATYKKSYAFKATVTDAKGNKVTSGNEKITWKSSNKKIATVKSNGKVTAKKKAGTVKITAKTADGKSATVKLKVSKKAVKVTKVKVTGSKKMNLKTKKTQTLKATVTPVTAANQKVTWKSSNKKIATVSSKGKVKVKKAGKVKITATAKDGSKKKATITITVKKK